VTPELPRFAWAWVLPAVAVELVLRYLASGPLTYGYMSDEFYYLDCVRHLAWGYVRSTCDSTR